MNKIIPERVRTIISARLNIERVYELRLRADMPIVICYGGKYYYLSIKGITDDFSDALVSTKEEISDVIANATQHSLYAVNNQLTNGFITVDGGVRVGICGELVRENAIMKTIKDFTSINIRIPHEIKGSALTAYRFINDSRLRSTLIVGAPGSGKTTILRDLCAQLSLDEIKNVLLIDERSEIASVKDCRPQMEIGKSTDIISNCAKEYAILFGLRSMRPDIIVTDELITKDDIQAVIRAVSSGVVVIASMHAKNIDELRSNINFKDLYASGLFSRYIFLSDRNGPGTYENVYDGKLKCIYFGN